MTAKMGNFYKIKELEAYGLHKKFNNYFSISQFEQLGWPDPFPFEIQKTSGKYKDPVILPHQYEYFI